jgi:hypothetical protein
MEKGQKIVGFDRKQLVRATEKADPSSSQHPINLGKELTHILDMFINLSTYDNFKRLVPKRQAHPITQQKSKVRTPPLFPGKFEGCFIEIDADDMSKTDGKMSRDNPGGTADVETP